MKKIIALVSATLFTLGMTSAFANDHMSTDTAATPAATTDMTKESDTLLLAKVKTDLVAHHPILGLEVDVDAFKDGHVTLKGKLDSEEDRTTIVNFVKSINGVTSVTDEIVVEMSTTTTTK